MSPKPNAKSHDPGHRPAHKHAHDPHHPDEKKKKPGKDLRRAYEHLARIDALLTAPDAELKLSHTARRARELVLLELKHDRPKAAAELARATEHIAFASLVRHDAQRIPWEGKLAEAFDHLYQELAEELGNEAEHDGDISGRSATRATTPAEDAQAEVLSLGQTLYREAESAHTAENYAQAIECMRAAEALHHVALRLNQEP